MRAWIYKGLARGYRTLMEQSNDVMQALKLYAISEEYIRKDLELKNKKPSLEDKTK